MRIVAAVVVVLCLSSVALAVPHSVRKQRANSGAAAYPYRYYVGRGMVPDAPEVPAIALPWQSNYGQQGSGGWNQQYLPNVPRPYYQTLPGWQVMPSLPTAPNYGSGNGFGGW